MIISHIECSCFIILLTGHVALVATTGTTKCVPYRLAKSLRSPFLDRVPVGFLYNGTRSSCGIKWWLGCCAVLLITGVRSQQVWWYVDRVSAMATKWHARCNHWSADFLLVRRNHWNSAIFLIGCLLFFRFIFIAHFDYVHMRERSLSLINIS